MNNLACCQRQGTAMPSNSSILGLAVAIGVLVASGAVAKDKEYAVGAIAIDFSGDREPFYGVGGGDTEDEATANALKFCTEAGGKNCKLAVAFPECGAYAASKKGGGWGKSTTKLTAEAKAMSGCNDDSCKIIVSDCN
jgi:uncharacterized protein DUF4189